MAKSGRFRELERKFHAAASAESPVVWARMVEDRHFRRVVDDLPTVPREDGEALSFARPLKISDVRVRDYLFDADLSGYRQGLEIRREGARLTFKFGPGGTKDRETLDRDEYMFEGVDIAAVMRDSGKKCRGQLTRIFGNSVTLYPLITTISQRQKFEYFRQSDDLTFKLEMAWDSGVGQTYLGQKYGIDQFEVEVKSAYLGRFGDLSHRADAPRALPEELHQASEDMLQREAEYLRSEYGLEPDYFSKPTPGVRLMEEEMDAAARRKIKKLTPMLLPLR